LHPCRLLGRQKCCCYTKPAWSGQRDSHPCLKPGELVCCCYTMAAVWVYSLVMEPRKKKGAARWPPSRVSVWRLVSAQLPPTEIGRRRIAPQPKLRQPDSSSSLNTSVPSDPFVMPWNSRAHAARLCPGLTLQRTPDTLLGSSPNRNLPSMTPGTSRQRSWWELVESNHWPCHPTCLVTGNGFTVRRGEQLPNENPRGHPGGSKLWLKLSVCVYRPPPGSPVPRQ
jgi:hypothetical protein